MKKRNVLIVDDDPDVLSMLERLLKKLEYNPFVAKNGEEAVQIIDRNKIDVVVSDLVMSEMGGMELLKRVKSRKGDVPFVMITGHPTIETAVEAIKKGAYDYLLKPISKDDLVLSINRALEKKRLTDIMDISKNTVVPKLINEKAFQSIVTGSESIQKILKEAELHARSTIPILITGGSGNRQGTSVPGHS